MSKLPTSIRLKPEVLAYVDEQAEKRGWSRSSWIAWLIDLYKKRPTAKQKQDE